MHTFTKKLSALLIILGILLSSCQTEKVKPLRIAISKEKSAKSALNYSNWLKRFDAEIVWFDMYQLGLDSALKLVVTCDGVLITGGEDVYPGLYGKARDTVKCGTIDHYRDKLEIALIKTAIENNMPLLGVCRGLQVINVTLGGSLIVDIPSDFGTAVIHRQEDWQNCFHPVTPVDATFFNVITDGEPGEVASNHHQGIDILGDALQISSYAADSLPESIEWDIRGEKGFLMAVQWHPERMDTLHHLSAPIAQEFLLEASSYQESK